MKTLATIIFCTALLISCQTNNTKEVEKSNTEINKPASVERQEVSFQSLDSLLITGHLYVANPDFPYILLCHQAGFNKFEYKDIALKINKLGFNCMAIDQRSGGTVDSIYENQTARRAEEKNLPTTYLDAEQDIIAAINYVSKLCGKPIILVGSSYSASLSLKIAAQNSNVKAVAAFSPGEYFGDKLIVAQSIKGMSKPVFVTSSKKEAPAVSALISEVKSDIKIQYTPQADGRHGASAMWEKFEFSAEYWKAFSDFLEKVK